MYPKNAPKNQFGPQSQNLASIIRGFKIGVTKNARQINPHFAWQPRYHDHIIRNEKSFYNISKYIINNPGKWTGEKFYQMT
ncbi:transposase [Thermophagus sp. OGC60D27]|uniref:transposase n=1 Tax=Thermophagus sp. OGC60D27 TaxID=3458415 RepID=UPI004037F997